MTQSVGTDSRKLSKYYRTGGSKTKNATCKTEKTTKKVEKRGGIGRYVYPYNRERGTKTKKKENDLERKHRKHEYPKKSTSAPDTHSSSTSMAGEPS